MINDDTVLKQTQDCKMCVKSVNKAWFVRLLKLARFVNMKMRFTLFVLHESYTEIPGIHECA